MRIMREEERRMKRSDHCKVTEIVLGKSYQEVHTWIDDLYPKYRGFMHWTERHHREALRKKYGDNTPEYAAGMLHILCDWLSHLGIFVVPNDKKQVLKLFKEKTEIIEL